MYKYWLKLQEQFFADRSRWYIWVPVLFGTGTGLYFSLPFEPSYWLTLGVIEMLILCAVIFRHLPHMLFILGIVAVVVAGFTNAQLHAVYQSKKIYPSPNKAEYVRGRIQKIEYNYKGAMRLIIENAENFEQNPLGKVRITLREKQPELAEGQCVELAAKVMPFFSPVIRGGYQFDRRAFFDGYSSGGYALSRVLQTDCPEKLSLPQKILFSVKHLREKIVKRIYAVLSPEEAGIAAAVVAGKRGLSPTQTIQNYRDSGLAHFLSISGLHMGMIAALSFFFLRLFLAFIPPVSARYDSKKIAAVFAIFISFVYLLISGMEIPAQRAFIMTFVVLLGVLFSRRAVSMYMLAWAAMIVLAISPQALTGPSFQMSFAAVACLIAFYEKFANLLTGFLTGGNRQISLFSKILRIVTAYFLGILVSDFVASLATLPFAIYHFNRIALYTSLANLLAGPVIGLVIMPFVLFSLCLMPFGLEEYPLLLVGWGIRLVNNITAHVAALPHAAPYVLSMPFWGLLLIIYGGLWLCIWTRPWRRLGGIAVLAGVLSLFCADKPHFLINQNGRLAAVRDENGNMVVLPGRREAFTRQVWQEKTAAGELGKQQKKLLQKIYKGETVEPAWLDLKCDKEKCVYRNRVTYYKNGNLQIDGKKFDIKTALGASIYLRGREIKVKTVREDIGRRLWN